MKASFQYSEELLSDMRKVADPVADEFVQSYFKEPQLKSKLYEIITGLEKNSDLVELCHKFPEEPLFSRACALPVWADEKLLQSGSSFFTKHADHILQLLGLLSLPYCYAAANGAMVLHLSERLKNDTLKRLTDTGNFVWDVQSENAFKPEGRGFAALVRTRIIHAIARFYTSSDNKWNPDWGCPVNQEDMAGTNLAFSLIIIRGLRKTGISVKLEQQTAFLHLWAVISFLLGTDERLIPLNGKEANWQEKQIRYFQFKASLQGTELTNSLVFAFAQTNTNSTTAQIRQLMRFLLGDEVSAMLGLDTTDLPSHFSYTIKLFFALNRFYGNMHLLKGRRSFYS